MSHVIMSHCYVTCHIGCHVTQHEELLNVDGDGGEVIMALEKMGLNKMLAMVVSEMK